MSDVDPLSNGDLRHRKSPAKGGGRSTPPVDPARRGQWVVLVAVISAATGAFLLLGASIAGILYKYLGIPVGVLFVFVVLSAIAGAWVGAWLAVRLTSGDQRRFKALGIGGSVGLFVAVALAYASAKFLPGFLPLLAILAPGGIAALSAGMAERARESRSERSAGTEP